MSENIKEQNVFFICLSENWGTLERGVIRDCNVANEQSMNAFLYCYKGSAIEERAIELGINTLHHHGKAFTKVFEWHKFRNIPQLLNQHNINFVHCYNIKILWPIAFFLRRYPGIPLVLTQRDEFKKFYKEFWYRPLISRLDQVLVPMTEMLENIKGHLGVPSKRIEFCGMGAIRFEDEQNNTQRFIKEEGELIFATNFGGEEKNLDHLQPLLKALEVFKKKGRAFKLILSSKKKWEDFLIYEHIQDEVRKCGLTENVQFSTVKRLGSIQKEVDIWIGLPKKEDLEDFCVTSLLNGTPVLFPRSAASMELLRELGKVGESYKGQDSRELRTKLDAMLKDLDFYCSNVKNSQKLLDSLYGKATYTAQFLSNYQRVIARRKRFVERRLP